MTWLLFLYAFTLGVERTAMIVPPELQWYGYTEFETSVLIAKTVEIGGATAIYFQPAQLPWFAPIEGDLRVFARMRFGMFSLEGEHLCIHGFYGGMASRDGKGYNRFTLTLSNRKP